MKNKSFSIGSDEFERYEQERRNKDCSNEKKYFDDNEESNIIGTPDYIGIYFILFYFLFLKIIMF
jgi:hypothetical protein